MHWLIPRARLALAYLFMGVLTPPALLLMVLALPSRLLRIRIGIAYAHLLGPGMAAILGLRFDVRGRERLQGSMPAIFVLNHSSMLDLLVGMELVPYCACGVAKKEMARVPLFGQAYLLSGHLLIDRGSRERAIAAMNETARTMEQHGLGAWLWPEGTRSEDGRLMPFKKGFVHLAIATGLPVVPIVIHDAPALWPARTVDIRPGTVRVEVLEPIDTSGWRVESVGEHAAAVHAVFVQHLPAHQHPG